MTVNVPTYWQTYRVLQKNWAIRHSCPELCEMLTEFQNSPLGLPVHL